MNPLPFLRKNSLLIFACIFLLIILGFSFYFFRIRDVKCKHSVRDEESYLRFCREILVNPKLYSTFRSHPLFAVFEEDLNEEIAREYWDYLFSHAPKFLEDPDFLSSLDSLGSPLKLTTEMMRLSYPTLRGLKFAFDLSQYLGDLSRKTIVQIGASDGSLTKILLHFFKPSRYCIVDLAEPLKVAKKMLHDWGEENVNFYTFEECKKEIQEPIDCIISSFVFSESRRNLQRSCLMGLIKNAHSGFFDCRFPMRHFGLKVWTPEEILSHLKKLGKQPLYIEDTMPTDLNRSIILFGGKAA